MPSFKLSSKHADEIRRLHRKGVSRVDLAKAYSVTRQLIGLVLRRKVWK